MADISDTLVKSLDKLLSQQKYALSVAESYGFVVGMVCAGLTLNDDQVVSNYQQILNDGEPLPEDFVSTLNSLFSHALEQLDRGLLQFRMILDDDEQPLTLRLETVSQWSQGWLLGFGHASDSEKMSTEGIEALGDIRDISQLEFELEEVMAAEDIEELERAYVEIIEHLKVTTEMLFLEKKQTSMNAPPTQQSRSIH